MAAFGKATTWVPQITGRQSSRTGKENYVSLRLVRGRREPEKCRKSKGGSQGSRGGEKLCPTTCWCLRAFTPFASVCLVLFSGAIVVLLALLFIIPARSFLFDAVSLSVSLFSLSLARSLSVSLAPCRSSSSAALYYDTCPVSDLSFLHVYVPRLSLGSILAISMFLAPFSPSLCYLLRLFAKMDKSGAGTDDQ